MREIKFRVWDLKRKKMSEPFGLEEYAYDQDNEYGSGEFSIYNPDTPQTLNTVMQFTGLKDKNGKEIYEGDVVYREILSSDDPALPGRYRESGSIECSWGVYRVKLGEEWAILSVDVSAMSLEVIGNIYENPELLK
jgi:hypothetical protein